VAVPPFRPEQAVILACARTRMDPEAAGRLRALLDLPLDWDYIITEARWHGVLPLLHWHLGEMAPSLVPAEVASRLRTSFERTQRRNLFLSLQLCAILRRFAAHGVGAIPYKGPTLAVMAYGRAGLREFADLDILVKKHDVLRAKEILVAEGYQSPLRLTEEQERALVDSQHAYFLVRGDRSVQVELHWEISPRYVSVPPEPERFWHRLEPVTLTGSTVHTLAPDVLLTGLCEHGSKHMWERLAWICDVAEMVRNGPRLDWARITADAARSDSRRTVALGLRLAENLLGAAVPEPMRVHAAGPAVSVLAAAVRTALFRDRRRRPGFFEQARFHLQLRERWRHRLRYGWMAATTLTVADWDRGLPRGLSFLYYPIRLLRLAGGVHHGHD
jgi:hypothetical protein